MPERRARRIAVEPRVEGVGFRYVVLCRRVRGTGDSPLVGRVAACDLIMQLVRCMQPVVALRGLPSARPLGPLAPPSYAAPFSSRSDPRSLIGGGLPNRMALAAWLYLQTLFDNHEPRGPRSKPRANHRSRFWTDARGGARLGCAIATKP